MTRPCADQPVLGSLVLAASVVMVCSGSPVGPATAPTGVHVVSGDNQTAVIGSVLPQAVEVRVVDSVKRPVGRQLVTFTVTAGGGNANDASSVTNDSGLARTHWTLGTAAGAAQRLEARVVDVRTGALITTVTVTATALPGKLAFVVQPQSAVEFVTLTPVVQVAAQDMAGNVAPGYVGAVTVGIAGSPGGTLLGVQTVGAVNGVAGFPGLSVSRASSGYTLTVAAQGFQPASSAAFGIAPNVPARLAFQVQPTPSFSGSPILPVLRVSALDQGGNPVTSFGGDISVALGSGAGGATLSGSTTVPAVGGMAAFSTLAVDGTGSIFTLVASTLGVESATTAPFSVCAGCWIRRPALPASRSRVGVASLNGRVYVVGGEVGSTIATRVDAYDPATAKWTSRPALPTARNDAATAVVNGILYVVGGFVASGSGGSESPVVEAYNPATNTWTTRAPMLTARRALRAASVDGILYAVGGITSDALATVEAYDPVTNSWTTKSPLPAPMNAHSIGVIKGMIYVTSAATFAYDPGTDTWATKATLPMPVSGAATAVLNDHMFVMGGCCFNPFRSSVWVYDPSTDTWSAGVDMPSARAFFGAAVVNGVIYVEGGMAAGPVTVDHNDAFRP